MDVIRQWARDSARHYFALGEGCATTDAAARVLIQADAQDPVSDEAAVFAIALVLVSLFTPLFASVVQRSALGGLDRGLG